MSAAIEDLEEFSRANGLYDLGLKLQEARLMASKLKGQDLDSFEQQKYSGAPTCSIEPRSTD